MAKMFEMVRGFKNLCRVSGVESPFVLALTNKQKDELMAELETMNGVVVDHEAPEDVDAERVPGLIGFVEGVTLVQFPFA